MALTRTREMLRRDATTDEQREDLNTPKPTVYASGA
jgi:hypothetical protein